MWNEMKLDKIKIFFFNLILLQYLNKIFIYQEVEYQKKKREKKKKAYNLHENNTA